MKLNNIKQVNDFLEAVSKCSGAVWLESKEGDYLNLKSELSKYVAIGQLIDERADDLELFCNLREDEAMMLKFFSMNPESAA